jgi:AraC-type DNA-binding domain-containing proteins
MIYCKDSNICYPIHTHISNYVLGFVLKGALDLEQNGIYKTCCEGDFFLINPDLAHSISPNNGKYSLLSICLPTTFLYQHNIEDMRYTLQILINYLENKNILTFVDISKLKHATEVLYAELTKTDISKNESMNKVKELLKTKELLKVKELIKAEADHYLSLKQLSEQVYVSQYYLIRVFKKQYGITPHQFQLQYRIRKAQQILFKEETVTEVALAAGFFDQSHFDRFFRKIVGITPSEYVKAQVILPELDKV